MDKKGQVNIGVILMLAMGAIIALAIIGSIINTQYQATNLQQGGNQTATLSSGCTVWEGASIGFVVNESDTDCNITADTWYPTNDWRADESQCALSSVVLWDSGGDLFVVDDDYTVFDSTGIIMMLNSTDTDSGLANTTIVANEYCAEGYNKDSSARGIARLWTLFAALALVAFVAYGIKSFNDMK